MSERDEFEAWFDREYPVDPVNGRRTRYLSTSVMDLMFAAYQAARAPQAVPALTEPIYQWRGNSIDNWTDCAKETYDNIGLTLDRYPADQPTPTWERRIVYAAPQPSPEQAVEPGKALVDKAALIDCLMLIDPVPVSNGDGTSMVFVNPMAAQVLTKLSAAVRRLVGAPEKEPHGAVRKLKEQQK